MPDTRQESLYLPVSHGHRLHLRRISQQRTGPVVLMLHGAIANGRIFYSESGKGLGPYLARQGFDVFVLDLRGRGGSTPSIQQQANHGQSETIGEDLPAVMAYLQQLRPDAVVHWIAHSWGGVLMSSALARHPALARQVRSCVYFGSKRSVRVWNWRKLLEVDLVWKGIAPWIAKRCGYLPARRLKMGADDETLQSLSDSVAWVRPGPWRDPVDDFDYGAACRSGALPPILYLVGKDDPCRGHLADVQRFRAESGEHPARIHVLSKAGGHRHDYDHVSMLTHPDAEADHFPLVLAWLRGEG